MADQEKWRRARAIKMTDEEWAAVKAAALEEGVSASEFVRRAVYAALAAGGES